MEGNGDSYEVSQHSADGFIARCYVLIRFSVKLLAVLMTFVIFWGVLDVLWVLYQRVSKNPYFLLDISDILATFGAFLAVLIALREHRHVPGNALYSNPTGRRHRAHGRSAQGYCF